MAKLLRTDPQVQEIIKQLSETKATSTAIYKDLLPKYFGQSFRKTEVLADIRRYRSTERQQPAYKSIPKKYDKLKEVPDKKRRLLDWQGKYNHMVSYKVNYGDGVYTEYITVSTNRKLTTQTEVIRMAEVFVRVNGVEDVGYRGAKFLQIETEEVIDSPFIDWKSFRYEETVTRIDDKSDL